MKIDIKRIDKSLPLPVYEKGAACFDFICRESLLIGPKEIKLVPANTVVKLPPGYTLIVLSRSHLPLKKGLMLALGVGVIDPFYCGDKDEIYLQFYNFTEKSVKVERGEQLAQGMIVKYETAEWNEVESMLEEGIGGYWAVKKDT